MSLIRFLFELWILVEIISLMISPGRRLSRKLSPYGNHFLENIIYFFRFGHNVVYLNISYNLTIAGSLFFYGSHVQFMDAIFNNDSIKKGILK